MLDHCCTVYDHEALDEYLRRHSCWMLWCAPMSWACYGGRPPRPCRPDPRPPRPPRPCPTWPDPCRPEPCPPRPCPPWPDPCRPEPCPEPICPPQKDPCRPEPCLPPQPKGWRGQAELAFSFPEHRCIRRVEVCVDRCEYRCCRLLVWFSVYVDYEDCRGCQRCKQFYAQREFCASQPCRHIHTIAAPQYDWSQGCLNITVPLGEKFPPPGYCHR